MLNPFDAAELDPMRSLTDVQAVCFCLERDEARVLRQYEDRVFQGADKLSQHAATCPQEPLVLVVPEVDEANGPLLLQKASLCGLLISSGEGGTLSYIISVAA